MKRVGNRKSSSFLLPRRGCSEGQREAGELCGGKAQPGTRLSHTTGGLEGGREGCRSRWAEGGVGGSG